MQKNGGYNMEKYKIFSYSLKRNDKNEKFEDLLKKQKFSNNLNKNNTVKAYITNIIEKKDKNVYLIKNMINVDVISYFIINEQSYLFEKIDSKDINYEFSLQDELNLIGKILKEKGKI